jgi:hypothetical protein
LAALKNRRSGPASLTLPQDRTAILYSTRQLLPRQARGAEVETHTRIGRGLSGSGLRETKLPLHIPDATKPNVVVPVLRMVPVAVRGPERPRIVIESAPAHEPAARPAGK